MVNCGNQFGSNHTGKLFEPRDLATNNLVNDYARGIISPQAQMLWLGINDIDIEGTFQYATGGNLAFTHWLGGQPDDYGGAQDCVDSRILGNWDDVQCDQIYASICEMI